MSGRILGAALVGVLLGFGVALGGSAVAEGLGADRVEYVMITSFQPETEWTEEYAAAGIRKLSAAYTEEPIQGFQSKVFVGAFGRGEFGGVYRFASADALSAFLAKHPPADNRTVKTYRLLEEWQAEEHEGS